MICNHGKSSVRSAWPAIVLTLMVLVLLSAAYFRHFAWAEDSILWNDVLAKNPRSARAFANLGIAFMKKNQFENAIEMSARSLAIVPNSISYNTLGNIYAKLSRNQEAIEQYGRAIALSKGRPEYFINRGIVFFNLGDYDKAIEDYTAAIARDPSFVDAYMNRGNAYDEKRDTPRAIADYNAGLRIDPFNGDIYFNRGVAYQNAGNLEAANKDYLQACSMGNKKACGVISSP